MCHPDTDMPSSQHVFRETLGLGYNTETRNTTPKGEGNELHDAVRFVGLLLFMPLFLVLCLVADAKEIGLGTRAQRRQIPGLTRDAMSDSRVNLTENHSHPGSDR
jgi:hypothetical protein